MKKLIDIQDAVGKTIQNCGGDFDNVLIVFEDDYFACLEAEQNDYSGHSSVSSNTRYTPTQLIGEVSPDRLISLGIVTEAEYDVLVKAKKDEEAKARQAQDIECYKRLKRKYEKTLEKLEEEERAEFTRVSGPS